MNCMGGNSTVAYALPEEAIHVERYNANDCHLDSAWIFESSKQIKCCFNLRYNVSWNSMTKLDLIEL